MRRSTLQSLLLACLFAINTSALAQGFYEFIPYYNNDPLCIRDANSYLFCWE